MPNNSERFKRILLRRLLRKYWGLETIRFSKKGIGISNPFALIENFWLFNKIVIDTKFEGSLNNHDVDGLVKNGNVKDATWMHLYISSNTTLNDKVVDYALENGVEIYRLHWNGREVKEV